MQIDEKLMADYPQLTYIEDPEMPEKQKGFIVGKKIYYNPNQSYPEKNSTVAEEIGHYLTGVCDITKQDTNEKRKQERKARDIGATILVTPGDIIDCFEAGCISVWECAEHLQITEETFTDAIKWYSRKWDGIITEDKHTIFFKKDGTMAVFKSLI